MSPVVNVVDVVANGAATAFPAAATAPSSGQLYGRPDRDPTPSPGGTVTQGQPGASLDTGKQEGVESSNMYPVQVGTG